MRAGGMLETQIPVIRPKQTQRVSSSRNWSRLKRRVITMMKDRGDTHKASRKMQGVAAVIARASVA